MGYYWPEAKPLIGPPEQNGATPVGQTQIAPKIATPRLFRGRNKGPELLVGREKELANLDAAWEGAGRKNVVAIVAWGGIGKTSLVAHWAAGKLAQPGHGGVERYFDWSFYSQGTRREGDPTGADKAAYADLFVKDALEFFGDREMAESNAGPGQKGQRLAQLVAQQRTLLILDGLESLQDAKTGELRDEALRVLLLGLAADSRGLCLVTTRQTLPDLATWRRTAAPEWELAHLSDTAGAALLSMLGVDGTDKERRDLSAKVKGHALTLTLLGRYLKRAHRGDIRRVDRVDFEKVNEKEQGGHAFRVIAAYEKWFEENDCRAELAILRVLGLFDRPAAPDCLAALCDPPIAGLTDALAPLSEEEWNEAVGRLRELDLVEEQPYEPRRVVGFGEEEAKEVWRVDREEDRYLQLGEPQPFSNPQSAFRNPHSLDAHPLIREFFGKRLREGVGRSASGGYEMTKPPEGGTTNEVWKTAHSRLFEHLRNGVPYWPEGLDGLQPLYQAVAHGCQAGRYEEARAQVYRDRILRGTSGPHAFYSTKKLGAVGADLAAVGCFFIQPWTQLAPDLSEPAQAWLLAVAAFLLRAVGRLTEAREPMRVSMDMCVKAAEAAKDDRTRNLQWKQAAIRAGNLSELELTLGNMESAVSEAEESVNFADRSGDAFQRLSKRTTHADALHQAGRTAEARDRFDKAETMQRERQPKSPLLYSVQGFQFCDLLLSGVECAAWASQMNSQPAPLNPEPATPNSPRPTPNSELATRNLEAALAASRSVGERAAQTLEWATGNLLSLLTIALDHLTLGRAALYAAVLEQSAIRNPHSAIEHLDAAVRGLRQAATMDHLPRGLLSRAWLHAAQDEWREAQALLDEAWLIAERGPMKLHMADVLLYRARLFHARTPYPWSDASSESSLQAASSESSLQAASSAKPASRPSRGPKDDLAAARRLIEQCGYWRRKEELADAEKASANW